MKIVEVTYRKKYNLGNYETHDIELKALVEDGEDPEEVLNKLKDACDNVHEQVRN